VSGEWSGGSQNRSWQRKGHRGGPVPGDNERGPRLYNELAGTPFWCDTCGGTHPLAEHKACRDGQRTPPLTALLRIAGHAVAALGLGVLAVVLTAAGLIVTAGLGLGMLLAAVVDR
jgi:hypothetical protein